MEPIIEIQHKDLTEDLIGDYIRITGVDVDGDDYSVFGLVDDFEWETDPDDEEFEDEILFIHTREDDGTVSCQSVSLFEIGCFDQLKIERFPDFGVSRSAMDDLLRNGGHNTI